MTEVTVGLEAHPPLRLVGVMDADEADLRAAREEIVRANRAASQLPPMDAALVFSRRVRDSLDGGPAAILTPERRRRLVDLAQRLGIAPFDANLMIAVVQDRVRRGEPLDQASLTARLDLLHSRMTRRRFTAAMVVGASLALALVMMLMMVRWVTKQ